jgi:hypothetical protein
MSLGSPMKRARGGAFKSASLADLMVPNRDYFACIEDEIADITSDLTMVDGEIVFGDGGFTALDEGELPPPMPGWSPVRRFGGYCAWEDAASAATAEEDDRKLAMNCGCANACTTHGHNHAVAWSSRLPISVLKSFWGVLGCACWAI